MRNWTCSIVSFLLMAASAVDVLPASSIASFFMGIDAPPKELMIELNSTDISEDLKIEIDALDNSVISETVKTNKSVLIYHTHTDEAFLKGDKDYVETSAGRTKNPDYSVVRVGKTLKEELERYGFITIHDTTDNVSPGFNKAYETSYNTIKKYIGSVDIFVDMHRDAYYGQTPHTVEQNNTTYARVCFVVAKGENYTQKPNWQENYKIAKALTDKMNELCPGICRDIIFKDTRFNQHVSDSCMLVEMGSEQNTLEQVNNSATILAKAFSYVFT